MMLKMYKQVIDLQIKDPQDDGATKRLLKQYIPDVRFDDSVSQNSAFVIVIEEGEPFYQTSPKGVVYRTPEINRGDVMAVVSRHAEYLWANKGVYSVHSSSINIDGKTILIPGRSGAGKTTLMMNLVKNFPQAKLISGDRTLVDGREIVGGTKLLNFIASSLREEFPDLIKILDTYTVGDRIRLDQEHSPFSYQQEPTNINAIVYPQKHPGKFTDQELKGIPRLTRLVYQGHHFLDEFPRLLLGIMEPLSTPVTQEDRKRVLAKIKDLTDNTPSYVIAGNLVDMVDFIEREIL
jgi:hypothetical protein